MLEDFMRRQEIDLMLLQEVTHVNISMIGNYTAHINIGTDGRGNAILVKEGLTLTNIQRVPSGRGIAATLHGILIVNTKYIPTIGIRKETRKGKPSTMGR